MALLDVWDGPVSAAIYFPFPSDVGDLRGRLGRLSWPFVTPRLRIVLVKPSFDPATTQHRLRYPINRLRNEALKGLETPFSISSDIDFLPSPLLVSALTTDIPAFLCRRPGTAVVVHSFRPLAVSGSERVDSAVERFAAHWWRKKPHSGVPDINAGHGPAMRHLAARPTLTWFEVLYEPQFEPYLVVSSRTEPTFDERFCDQGGDKQSRLASMNAAGWKFFGVSGGYLMHASKDDVPDLWPSDRFDGLDQSGPHFSSAQTDTERFRYFQNYLPQLAHARGRTFRLPKGAGAWTLASGRSYGREGAFGPALGI